MLKHILAAALSATLALHAHANESYQLELGASNLNQDLPSASGMAYRNGFFYAVGDDAQWLFELDQNFHITDKQLIKAYPLDPNGRINKKVKPDFEAMAQFRQGKQTWSMVLGSGSKAVIREVGFLLSSDRISKHERNLLSLYTQLKMAAGISELNIEGLVLSGSKAYILNRGNGGGNLVFAVKQNELIDYMFGKLDGFSKIETFKVKLPQVAGFEAGLSGGDYWAKNNSLVYTASVEATGDSYNDGQILGSFIGVIPLGKLKAGEVMDLTPTSVPLLDANGRVVITKAESLAITSSEEDEIKGAIASDNDNGTSEFFRFKLEKND
ncbi:hypothetical protein HQ393_15100 [Chitinibacter bivalviorum]|uniref:Uncharacterized protein n=1 Tax=Chitinibacter bivalviorum TaxID=2739434 RepID=A0A7H9BLZ4_9NEIS|nr:hypothetical protein [Chitinibacter bivalviorum]QLG89462.1 hypothetical protein HQ393_15100 [Chitinibacter bivalviorum]